MHGAEENVLLPALDRMLFWYAKNQLVDGTAQQLCACLECSLGAATRQSSWGTDTHESGVLEGSHERLAVPVSHLSLGGKINQRNRQRWIGNAGQVDGRAGWAIGNAGQVDGRAGWDAQAQVRLPYAILRTKRRDNLSGPDPVREIFKTPPRATGIFGIGLYIGGWC